MNSQTTVVTWEAIAPSNGAVSQAWLERLWEFRGETLYDGGRRPQFRRADGRRVDQDPLDSHSYHVLARCDGGLVGCIRLLPSAHSTRGLTEQTLGCLRFEEILASLGTTRRATADVGRWIVHPEFRQHHLALSLLGGAWAYLQQLGFRTAVATVGTRAKQDLLLNSAGLMAVPGVAVEASTALDDELRTMYAVVARPASRFRGVLERMAREIGFS